MSRRDSISKFIGLAGVDPRENGHAKKWAARLEWPMLVVTLWIIVTWYLEASDHLSQELIGITDWLVWGFFFAETAIITTLVDSRITYLKQNWINLVIIVFGFPLIWWYFPFTGALRVLRILAMFSLLLHISKTARTLLSKYNLGTTLAFGFVVIIMAGFIMAGIDPAIKTPMDGIWWALVTITTVGYGDIVPVSTAGRLFGAVLIVLGLALISVLTASFAAFFISEDERKMQNQTVELQKKIQHLEIELKEMRILLEEIAKNTGPHRPDRGHHLPPQKTSDV